MAASRVASFTRRIAGVQARVKPGRTCVCSAQERAAKQTELGGAGGRTHRRVGTTEHRAQRLRGGGDPGARGRCEVSGQEQDRSPSQVIGVKVQHHVLPSSARPSHSRFSRNARRVAIPIRARRPARVRERVLASSSRREFGRHTNVSRRWSSWPSATTGAASLG